MFIVQVSLLYTLRLIFTQNISANHAHSFSDVLLWFWTPMDSSCFHTRWSAFFTDMEKVTHATLELHQHLPVIIASIGSQTSPSLSSRSDLSSVMQMK